MVEKINEQRVKNLENKKLVYEEIQIPDALNEGLNALRTLNL